MHFCLTTQKNATYTTSCFSKPCLWQRMLGILFCQQQLSIVGTTLRYNAHLLCSISLRHALHTLMRHRHGSTRGYAHSEDLETGVRRSGATDRPADGATTRALQPPLRLIPSFRQPCAFSARSDHPETRQERRAQVIQHAHSESECVVTRIALNNTKTTLVVFKSLTARADISELYK